jgi:hypothetical protein
MRSPRIVPSSDAALSLSIDDLRFDYMAARRIWPIGLHAMEIFIRNTTCDGLAATIRHW